MEGLELKATPRDVTGKKVKQLRREGIVPGIIYGHDIDPISVQFDSLEIERTINRAGSSTTVQVRVEGEKGEHLTIFRDVQYDPIKRNVIHLDLQALRADETVRVPLTVTMVGTSPMEEDPDAIVLQILNELEIEALPRALIPYIEVDISTLTEIGQSITVADLEPPEGVTILNEPHESIVQVSYAEEEVLEEEPEVPEFLGEVEVIGEAPEEGEEMPEGEEAPEEEEEA
ncbi:MAG: 50S ribosomal protein L25 [Chloroflexi bacterium]|jgi:large subunit ribosomal protein L25|nr:50S ribosomal protein L25 [Chloroflexota bacterium]